MILICIFHLLLCTTVNFQSNVAVVASSTQPSNAAEDVLETTDSQYDESDYDDEDYDDENPKVSAVTPTTQKTTTPVRVDPFFHSMLRFTVSHEPNGIGHSK